MKIDLGKAVLSLWAYFKLHGVSWNQLTLSIEKKAVVQPIIT